MPQHPMVYSHVGVDVPLDAPQVTVYDNRTEQNWLGFVHEGIVYDKSGFVDPFDIGYRFEIFRDGVNVSSEFAEERPEDHSLEFAPQF